MADISITTNTRGSVSVLANDVIQCKQGLVLVGKTNVVGDGILLGEGDGIPISADGTLYYERVNGAPAILGHENF